MNVVHSEITCKSNQIRLDGCKNIILKASTKTGIFLQDSIEIVIHWIDDKSNKKNFDFNNPYESVNYQVI